jgi:hypothetical protein
MRRVTVFDVKSYGFQSVCREADFGLREAEMLFSHTRKLTLVKKRVFLCTIFNDFIAYFKKPPYLCIVNKTKRVPQAAGKFPNKIVLG